MSSTPQAVDSSNQARTPEAEIVIISHSTMFYWWPVWAIGFILGLLTLLDPHVMVVVPKDSKRFDQADVTVTPNKGESTTYEKRPVLVLPQKEESKKDLEEPSSESKLVTGAERLGLHMTTTSKFGVLFATILLAVIFVTNVPLRGMWSVGIVIVVVLLAIIFILAGWSDWILRQLHYLDIRINAGGYIFLSLILFILWLVVFVFFDRQIYMVFTPGQFKVCTEVGGGEQVFSAAGISLEKRRSDLFRHWILGLGSGDLAVRTSGAQSHHFELPNVLFIGRKVQRIEDMLKKMAVIETR
jgi:hypothetical protein